MSSKAPSNTTSVTTQEPPAYAQPFLQQAATESQNLYAKGPNQYYSGNTVTPFSNETEQALTGITNRATQGSDLNRSAQEYVQGALSSDPTSQFGSASNPYAGGENPYAKSVYDNANNPYLDATFNRAADSVQNRLQSSFAGSGRNIGGARPVAALELNDLANQVYGGAYESDAGRRQQADLTAQGIGSQSYLQGQQIGASGYENAQNRQLQDLTSQRSNQAGLAGLAPTLANQDYADYGQLLNAGAQREDLASRNIADQVSRFDYAQNAPGMLLDQYIARLNNQPGGSATSTTPYFTNRAAGALGGAALGQSIYPGGLGALGGGLLGAFG